MTRMKFSPRYDIAGFWRHIDRADGSGTLVVFTLTSWKHVGDHYGHLPSDVILGVFDAVCSAATENAPVSGRAGWRAYGAYWPGSENANDPAELLDRWVPATLTLPAGELSCTIAHVTVPRAAGESGRSIYERAQAELDAISEASSSLWKTWDQVIRRRSTWTLARLRRRLPGRAGRANHPAEPVRSRAPFPGSPD